jgi:hypothetical protein
MPVPRSEQYMIKKLSIFALLALILLPAGVMAAGVQGSISKLEALKVGVIIEETDIDDLNEGIATTRHNDIKTVYSNLLQGSLNHLDAFESTLAK